VKISVVVPTHNRSELLRRTLAGLLEQSAPAGSYEIVVVDDGSTDDTPQVIQESARLAAGRLRQLRQDAKGPAAARNLGVREAKGRLILFTGDDCLPDRRLIEEHLKAHREEGDVGVIGHITWHPDLEVTPFMAFLEDGVQFGFRKIKDPHDVSFWHCYSSNLSLSRRWLEKVGGFDEDFKHAAWEDIELGYRLHQRGLRLVYRPQAVTYHHHPTTLERYLVRQRIAGRSAALFYRKHPEVAEDLGIAHAARPIAGKRFYLVLMEYAFAVGVREGLLGEGAEVEDESAALWRDPGFAQSGRAWIHEVFGGDDPVRMELVRARRDLEELRQLRQEYEAVTSRRLYRISEAVAKAGWRVLRALGLGRRRRAG